MTLHYICRCHSQDIPTEFPWELMYIKGRTEKGETLCQTNFFSLTLLPLAKPNDPIVWSRRNSTLDLTFYVNVLFLRTKLFENNFIFLLYFKGNFPKHKHNTYKLYLDPEIYFGEISTQIYHYCCHKAEYKIIIVPISWANALECPMNGRL